ncbi:Armadillo-type fold [Phytophthora cinnamomi]|uniref:Armadillo-type fold n=1 Tax=Phytophthora cinnamomi TaxID=4785 RepID=UPI003559C52B|nr:Armadillo-type fold [Phytophthora cinnamomi]
MGGAVSELRGEIHTHVLIVQHYPTFLEPVLAAVQYFLHTAELGEGTNRANPLEEISMDVVITDKQVYEEASTEVEVLSENPAVTEALLHAVRNYRQLELSPDIDTFKRWYDPPWRNNKPFPTFVVVPPDEVPRFRIAVLRTSIRCLRLMMLCHDGKRQLEESGGPAVLNQAVLENPLDDFVKNDVKAIFSAVYGGDNAVRRIVISNVPIVVEMMKENHDSAFVQLAGNQSDKQEKSKAIDPVEVERLALFAELDTFAVVTLVTETLNRFDVDKYLSLYVHACRFFSFVAIEERNAKLVGQTGGIDGSIRLLFKAREMQREKKADEKAEADRLVKIAQSSESAEWLGLLTQSKKVPPPPPVDASGQATSIASLAVVDFTPTEIGQQALWALDLLATLDFNVSMMKLHRLKYLLEEIRLDPDGKELGAVLILTRRLRLIRWDQVGAPSPEKPKRKADA